MHILERLKKRKFDIYRVVECEHCKTQLAVGHQEFEHTLFEPKEVEVPFWTYNPQTQKLDSHTRKEMHSSDSSRDLHTFHCCYCGHDNVLTTEQYKNTQIVNAIGEDYYKPRFLSDVGYERLKKFQDEHKSCRIEHHDALGQHVEYRVLPGGLGSIVVAKCLHCGEEEYLEDSNDW